ncbi:hypothetical protein LCGC14_3156100, partial [marine sediment metagenome]
ALTIASNWLYRYFSFDYSNRTYDLPFFDGVNTYRVDGDIPDLYEPVDFRLTDLKDHDVPFSRKTPRELAKDILTKLTKE